MNLNETTLANRNTMIEAEQIRDDSFGAFTEAHGGTNLHDTRLFALELIISCVERLHFERVGRNTKVLCTFLKFFCNGRIKCGENRKN